MCVVKVLVVVGGLSNLGDVEIESLHVSGHLHWIDQISIDGCSGCDELLGENEGHERSFLGRSHFVGGLLGRLLTALAEEVSELTRQVCGQWIWHGGKLNGR